MQTAAELVIHLRHEAPSHIPLSPGVHLVLGRSSSCDVPVRDRYLSRRHAHIRSQDGSWWLRDLGSANGTWVDGKRIEGDVVLESGARFRIGDTDIEFFLQESTERVIALPDRKVTPTLSVAIEDGFRPGRRTLERVTTFNALVLEALEEQPYNEMFPFMLERLITHLEPSRAAIVLLDTNSRPVRIESRSHDPEDRSELLMSQTIVQSIVEQRHAMAWNDISANIELSRSRSLAIQGIRSVACAPMIAHDNIIGLLYVDYQLHNRAIDEDDLLLIAQIARFAAIRIENARLREDLMQKRLLEEEMRTAASVQRHLLPATPPPVDGWSLSAVNHAVRGVSGDYYDFNIDSRGRLWIVVGDVSGKGINAALLMASLQAAFRIFVREVADPGELCGRLNAALRDLLPPSRYVTLFAARIETTSGLIEYANAGHQPPLLIHASTLESLDRASMPLGMFRDGHWETNRVVMSPGDVMLMFTDGLAEIEGQPSQEFGDEHLAHVAAQLHGLNADEASLAVATQAASFASSDELADDLTLVVASRRAQGVQENAPEAARSTIQTTS